MIVLTMHRGDDKIYELTVTNKQTGNAVDITGCTITWTWKEEKEDASYFLQKSNGPGEHSDPMNGKTEFTIDAADTASLTAKMTYFWDVEITKTTLKKETLCLGKIRVLLDVTT